MQSDLATQQYRKTWDTYTASWKAISRKEKLELFSKSLTPDCNYTDPTVQTQGWEELADNMMGFHSQIPGGHFVTTYFLAHNKRSITRWEMRNAENQHLADGISYGEYDDAGKLTSMTGFFEVPG